MASVREKCRQTASELPPNGVRVAAKRRQNCRQMASVPEKCRQTASVRWKCRQMASKVAAKWRRRGRLPPNGVSAGDCRQMASAWGKCRQMASARGKCRQTAALSENAAAPCFAALRQEPGSKWEWMKETRYVKLSLEKKIMAKGRSSGVPLLIRKWRCCRLKQRQETDQLNSALPKKNRSTLWRHPKKRKGTCQSMSGTCY